MNNLVEPAIQELVNKTDGEKISDLELRLEIVELKLAELEQARITALKYFNQNIKPKCGAYVEDV
ncbi:MAG: hypothetical protein ACYSUK_00105 [Planctomycetota bacterium]|jgi:hypothetical protein